MSSKKANRSRPPHPSRPRVGWFSLAVFLALCPAVCRRAAAQTCVACHPREAAAFAQTGMGRSFSVPLPGSIAPVVFYHRASDTYFAMVERGGKYFQRQYQIGFDGKQTDAFEKRVDYVLGSGNHSKTYLSRTASNALIELPLAWYAEKGGYWDMNPGYDSASHQGFRRRVGDDCMFCHNAYPKISADVQPGIVPLGIDCERCHGPGQRHMANPREPIVNPARLTPTRQAEACEQCHLETTSSPLPGAIVRYGREPFSYQAGQPLADFKLFFDRAADLKNSPDPKERFEINSSAWRLAMSACALKSGDKLTCSTCHDPHDPKTPDYTATCRQCHAAAFKASVNAKKHTAATDCVGCHMPKRRTADAVHVVMTDHYIQRRKPARDLLADLPEHVESYRGAVIPYGGGSDELYTAVAQVIENSNLHPGIQSLSALLEKTQPREAEPWLELADALRRDGECRQALPVYEDARRRDPASLPVMQRTALCLNATDAIKLLLKAPQDAGVLTQLGTAYAGVRQPAAAIVAFRKALSIDPEQPEAWNDLGGLLMETGENSEAEKTLRNAIRLQPNYAEARNNLASLLARTARFEEARYQFEAALRYKPDYNFARLNYGIVLGQMNRFAEAATQFEQILKTDPNAADTHEALGMVLAAQGQSANAIAQYREALRIRPDFGRAHLSLGSALVASGDVTAGRPHLQAASKDPDPSISKEAQALLSRYR